MKIKDQLALKTKDKPVTFSAESFVREALDVMCEKNIGSIVVVNDDQTVAGILTERDMMIRVLGANKDPDKTRISDIMSTEVRCANENDELIDWLKVMSSERFRHLPIVDGQGKLVTMMSQGDFVAHTWPDLHEKLMNNLKGRLGRGLQFLLFFLAIITLGLIAFQL